MGSRAEKAWLIFYVNFRETNSVFFRINNGKKIKGEQYNKKTKVTPKRHNFRFIYTFFNEKLLIIKIASNGNNTTQKADDNHGEKKNEMVKIAPAAVIGSPVK